MSLAYEIVETKWRNKVDSKGTPYILHVQMGVAWLRQNYRDHPNLEAMCDAFCLHPLVQDFTGLQENIRSLSSFKTLAYPLALAIEYRNQANWYGTWNYETTTNRPHTVMLEEVKIMLKADKLQNCWNLFTNRRDHPKFKGHQQYFVDWFDALEIDYPEINDAYSLFDALQEVL